MARIPATERFSEAARALGFEPDITIHEQGSRTADDAAVAIGCDVGQIVKSLIFDCGGTPILALTSGANQVDLTSLAEIGGGEVGRADAAVVRATTGFAIGGIPPFGHLTPLRTFVDRSLLAHDVVFGAAGTPESIFPIAPGRLVELTGGEVADFAGS